MVKKASKVAGFIWLVTVVFAVMHFTFRIGGTEMPPWTTVYEIILVVPAAVAILAFVATLTWQWLAYQRRLFYGKPPKPQRSTVVGNWPPRKS